MTVSEAKNIVLQRIHVDLELCSAPILLQAELPELNDPAKFLLNGKIARVIVPFDGWPVPINLKWFTGSFDEPRIQNASFYWYAFAIPSRGRLRQDHYLICDFLQVREWVLEFASPMGRDHRDHYRWRADIIVDRGQSHESQAYFRWGDEPTGKWAFVSRIVLLDNIEVVASQSLIAKIGKHIGSVSPTGESEAHRRLKVFVSQQPSLLGLSTAAVGEIEHSFCTGDRVDVLFSNHGPKRAVAEIELDQEDQILIGIHQAIKYRGLAAAEGRLPIRLPDVAAYVISYGGLGVDAKDLAKDYDISLIEVDRQKVLAPQL
jgi:hypothetical protein